MDGTRGWGRSSGGSLSGRLQADLEAGFSTGRDDAQWITNVDATGDGATDHVYGRSDSASSI